MIGAPHAAPALQGVHIVASLPCYSAGNVDAQRGWGVFERSIVALKQLNALGYGRPGTGLQLDLVYNPGGPFLAPPQAKLEATYKQVGSLSFGGSGGGGVCGSDCMWAGGGSCVFLERAICAAGSARVLAQWMKFTLRKGGCVRAGEGRLQLLQAGASASLLPTTWGCRPPANAACCRSCGAPRHQFQLTPCAFTT